MKTTLLLSLAVAASMAAASFPAVAGPASQPASFRGAAAPTTAQADQVIVVTDATRHVNVAGGSTVRFVVGDRTFSWTFDNGSATVIPFDMSLIAPSGVVNHAVTVYVSDNQQYRGS